MVVPKSVDRKPEARRPCLVVPGEVRPLRRRTAADMSPGSFESGVILWHEGPRTPLRHLFELADDSSTQIDSYIDLGRVLVARNARGEILGHIQLIPTASADTVELNSIAVREDHQHTGIGRRLVDRALAICREEGVQTVTVTTSTVDLDNLRFYGAAASVRRRSSETCSPRRRDIRRNSRRTASPAATASPSRSSSTQPHSSTEADSTLLSRRRGLTQRRLRASGSTRRRRRS